eukprot:UN03581
MSNLSLSGCLQGTHFSPVCFLTPNDEMTHGLFLRDRP